MRIDQEKHLDKLIDQALREFPFEPVPDRLKASILGQIEKPARFRISWIDLALSSALALLFGITVDFIQGVARSPYWSARLRVGVIGIWRGVKYFLIHNQPSLLGVLLSAGVVLSLLAVLAGVYRRFAANPNGLPS